MSERSSENAIIQDYINVALKGHYPLFENAWLKSSNKLKGLNYPKAQKNVKHMFKILARHNTDTKKKMVLESLRIDERNLYIQSFITLVEHNLLKACQRLQ